MSVVQECQREVCACRGNKAWGGVMDEGGGGYFGTNSLICTLYMQFPVFLCTCRLNHIPEGYTKVHHE